MYITYGANAILTCCPSVEIPWPRPIDMRSPTDFVDIVIHRMFSLAVRGVPKLTSDFGVTYIDNRGMKKRKRRTLHKRDVISHKDISSFVIHMVEESQLAKWKKATFS